jgi:enterobactin synthetase component D / holo-[acyl-carrier protein] synthase
MPANHLPSPRPAGLIAGILPPVVAAAESVADAPAADGLFPVEAAAVRTAEPWRRAEFAAGRLCARAAMASLGLPATPILPGPAGQPQWPTGVTGSITHCAGYQACAVALTTDVTAIGIDAEPDVKLPADLIEMVAAPREQEWIRQCAAILPALCWDRLIFSAKESAAKLWYPLTGQWLVLQDMTVRPAIGGTFDVCLLPGPGRVRDDPPGSQMTGHWLSRDGLIVTAITWMAVRHPRCR